MSLDSEQAPLIHSHPSPISKRTWRKIDVQLLPIVTSMLLIALLDRSNIGNALVAGLKRDLGLSDPLYNAALCVTWITYGMTAVPATLLIKRKGAKLVLPMMVFLAGLASMSQGFATSFWSLTLSRILLGIFEAGLFPGLVMLISEFYPHNKLQVRIAILSSTIAFSGAFSGLLAAGIMKISRAFAHPGWSWIFIVEGLGGAAVGLYALKGLPVTMNEIRLTNTERTAIKDVNPSPPPVLTLERRKLTMKQIMNVAFRPHVFLMLWTTLCLDMAETGLAYFEPDIVHQLGYTSIQAQLMSVPPFLMAFILSIGAGYASDNCNQRGLVAGLSLLTSLIGFVMYYLTQRPILQYISLFLSLPGTISSVPAMTTWLAINVSASSSDRAIAVALNSCCNCLGSVASVWIFGSMGYKEAVGICVLLQCGALSGCVGCWAWMRKENRNTVTQYRL